MSSLNAGKLARWREHGTCARRLRRGLITLGMVAALPGAFTTSSASALTAVAAGGSCNIDGTSYANGEKVEYHGFHGTCVDGKWRWGSEQPH